MYTTAIFATRTFTSSTRAHSCLCYAQAQQSKIRLFQDGKADPCPFLALTLYLRRSVAWGRSRETTRLLAYPASNKLAITTRNSNNVKHSRLKRIFSGKNLNGSTTSIARSTTGLRRSEVVVNGASGPKIDDSKENSVSVSIENMDPPLPVIKKVQQPADGGEASSLWKRRSGGLALKNLQLREIQLNRNNLAPTTA
ncbi:MYOTUBULARIN-LIKE PROTEIN [Salix viminalis]|uniref:MYOTUBULARIN-LIKE PROTEIN n=1 Tax=Salix viminalis TaxID=40686 RepID=A0A9Q0USR1_SALVM|nr:MYOTUBULARIN-LIKE PROTEIN [Salix viminalis]